MKNEALMLNAPGKYANNPLVKIEDVDFYDNKSIKIEPTSIFQKVLVAANIFSSAFLMPLTSSILVALIIDKTSDVEQSLSSSVKASIVAATWLPFALAHTWIQLNYAYRRANGEIEYDIIKIAGYNYYWNGVAIAFFASINQAAIGIAVGMAFKQIPVGVIFGLFKWLGFMLSDVPAAWIKLMEAKQIANQPIRALANHRYSSLIYNRFTGGILHNIYAPVTGLIHTIALAEVIIRLSNPNNISENLKYGIYAISVMVTFLGSAKYAEYFDMRYALKNIRIIDSTKMRLIIFSAVKSLRNYANSAFMLNPLNLLAGTINLIGLFLYGKMLNNLFCMSPSFILGAASIMNCLGLIAVYKRSFDIFVLSQNENEGLLAKFILGSGNALNIANNYSGLLMGLSLALGIVFSVGQTYIKYSRVSREIKKEIIESSNKQLIYPLEYNAEPFPRDHQRDLIDTNDSVLEESAGSCCPWFNDYKEYSAERIRTDSFSTQGTYYTADNE